MFRTKERFISTIDLTGLYVFKVIEWPETLPFLRP